MKTGKHTHNEAVYDTLFGLQNIGRRPFCENETKTGDCGLCDSLASHKKCSTIGPSVINLANNIGCALLHHHVFDESFKRLSLLRTNILAQ